MNCELFEFEAIGQFHSDKLAKAGIKTMDDLLRYCSDKKSRNGLARRTGISESLILGWADLADLMRISGVVSEYARLLNSAGVGTITDLRSQTPEMLESKLAETNSLRKFSRDIPSIRKLTEWVAQAKAIEPFVKH